MSSAERLSQLKQADDLLAQDASHYPAIFPVVLTLAAQPDAQTRRWIAAFLTRTFSARPSLDAEAKEALLARDHGAVLDSLLTLLSEGNGDAAVVKNTVLSSSLIYPILFRRMYVPRCPCVPCLPFAFCFFVLPSGREYAELGVRCKNSSEASLLWGKLTRVKARVVQIWDQSENEGVRIACVKFIEKVIATQTPGIKDPRVSISPQTAPILTDFGQLADRSDISSTIVPLNHPVIHLPALEAESQGFLDRLLSVILEKPMSLQPGVLF